MNQPALEMNNKNEDYDMSHEVKLKLALTSSVLLFGNALNHLIIHYHEIAGGLLSTISALYVLWKWRNEYLAAKRKRRKA